MVRATRLAGLETAGTAALPLYPVRPAGLDIFLGSQEPAIAAFIRAQNFKAEKYELVILPGADGISGALLGLGDDGSPAAFGGLAGKLPARTIWRLMPGDYDPGQAVLGAAMGAYRFDRLKPRGEVPARIVVPPSQERSLALAEAVCLARDLVNTPANLLGPVELADAGADLAARFDARVQRVTGIPLTEGYPALAAVGAGSAREAQMLRFTWGNDPSLPLVSLCGKGVCFDTGGYDIKPSAAMLRMKKDMGGAAITLGVAQAVMALNLRVRLDVRIGCVENSISGHAMRPLDVLRTRSGLTVEVGNTDAEGRLVLADLLTDAVADKPDRLIDFATLTGAARVALGPDLPALFANDDQFADTFLTAAAKAHDPLWRLPLWADYAPWLDSNIADSNTVSQKPFAGAIIAALFLNRFVPSSISWAHIDTYAWNDQTRPGRPEGGEAQGLRAAFATIETIATSSNK